RGGGKMRRADRLEEHRDDADRARLNRGLLNDRDHHANPAQHEYWNTVAGPRWVGLGGFVERRARAVTDLLLMRSEGGAGESVLQIGCGTGAATILFAEAADERGRVVGVDISEPMLASARQRISESGLRNIELLQADAQVHHFEPGRFDLIASHF